MEILIEVLFAIRTYAQEKYIKMKPQKPPIQRRPDQSYVNEAYDMNVINNKSGATTPETVEELDVSKLLDYNSCSASEKILQNIKPTKKNMRSLKTLPRNGAGSCFTLTTLPGRS